MVTWFGGWQATMGPGGTGWMPEAAPEGPTSGGRKWLVSSRLSNDELSYSSETGIVEHLPMRLMYCLLFALYKSSLVSKP